MKIYKALMLILVWSFSIVGSNAQTFNRKIQAYSESIIQEFDQIDKKRIVALDEINQQIFEDLKKYTVVQPLLVCTHNSRRSQMAQLWLHTAAEFYGIDSIKPYSGGTESTAFNKNAINALKRAGFNFQTVDQLPNQSVYLVTSGRSNVERLMFSKVYNDKINPAKSFFAIMVCSEADESCPLVSGSDARFSLPYDDPRYFDNTPSQKSEYEKTCRLIAREMFYITSKVKEKLNLEAEKLKR